MQRFVSRPQVVEAVQWDGVNIPSSDFIGVEKCAPTCASEPPYEWTGELQIRAGKDGAQEWVPVPVGHWIVRLPGDDSDYWPVDPDYFAQKYEVSS